MALSAAALLALVVASISPLVPSAAALDPTPDPSAVTTPDPGPTPTAEPSAGPTPEPPPTPAPPTPAAPTPAAPTPAAPTPDPAVPTPAAEPAPTPATTPGPVAPTAAPGPTEIPIYPLVDPSPPILVPMSLIDPTISSPHVMDSLVSDGCSACHASHASGDGKLLEAAYRTDLKPVGQPYARSEFGVCYTCHEPEPFEASGTGGTNFDLHAAHLGAMPADGNAVCAECHYRLHATAAQGGSKLVEFSPNVVANGAGDLEWTGTVTRSCSLTCHGYEHVGAGY
ncbi:MAG TPA: cytochrome c3 family protein [Candidatus Limnocylindrales bacterium]|nr:cytochrome c3 family protein [Candidatus Limnocylindrales bacterium]